MARAQFPFSCFPTPAVRAAVGPDIGGAAVAALRALLIAGHGFEIAHQQIRYGEHDLAFSCRVTENGELILDIDIGEPGLRDRIVLEADLRREAKRVKGIRDEYRRRRGN
jgi:hypothetical protein